jgi:hypothetical protein
MKEWYYAIESQIFGPFPENELSVLVRDGVLTPSTLVWNNELDNSETAWTQASDTELNILFPHTLEYKPVIHEPVNNHNNSPVIIKQDSASDFHNSSNFSKELVTSKNTEITNGKNANFFSKFQNSVGEINKTSEKQLNTSNRIFDMGLFQSFILIVLSIAIYFILRHYLLFQYANSGFLARNAAKISNYVVQKLILDPYSAILFDIISRALIAAVIPAIVYIIFMCCFIKYPKIEKIFPWIAYVALVVLIMLLYRNGPPSPTDFLSWFWGFINTSSVAIVFGLYFHSRKLGSGIAFCVLCILNFLVYISFGALSTVVGLIPLVNIFGGLAISGFRLVINVVEISQVFMIIAVGNITKFIIDLCMRRYFGITPIRNNASAR